MPAVFYILAEEAVNGGILKWIVMTTEMQFYACRMLWAGHVINEKI